MPVQPFENFQPATGCYHPDNAIAMAEAARLAYRDAVSVTSNALQWGFPRCRFLEQRETLVYFSDKGELSGDPGWWDAFLNRMKMRIEDLGKMGPANLKRHSIDLYIELCEKNRMVNPF